MALMNRSPAGAATQPIPEGSIAVRVGRCLDLACAIENEAGSLWSRLENPNRVEAAAPSAPEPEPSHLVFALEKLERVLDRVRASLGRASEALS